MILSKEADKSPFCAASGLATKIKDANNCAKVIDFAEKVAKKAGVSVGSAHLVSTGAWWRLWRFVLCDEKVTLSEGNQYWVMSYCIWSMLYSLQWITPMMGYPNRST